jgi:hypothetical protein
MVSHDSEADGLFLSSLYSSLYVRPLIKLSFGILKYKWTITKMIILTQSFKKIILLRTCKREMLETREQDSWVRRITQNISNLCFSIELLLIYRIYMYCS